MASNVPRSTLWRMADTLMAGKLLDRLQELRAEGRSYDEISRVLYADARVNISGRTIRDWFVQLGDDAAPDDDEPAAKVG
jgi:hypothetical protein